MQRYSNFSNLPNFSANFHSRGRKNILFDKEWFVLICVICVRCYPIKRFMRVLTSHTPEIFRNAFVQRDRSTGGHNEEPPVNFPFFITYKTRRIRVFVLWLRTPPRQEVGGRCDGMLQKLQVLDTEVVKSKMGVCEVKMRKNFLFEDGNECFRKLGAMLSNTQSNAFKGQEHSFGPLKAML